MSDFQLQFQEQIDFLSQKINLPTETHNEITSRQHDRAFVVAGAMKADLLNDLHQAVNQAVADGQSFKQFQDSFDDILAKHGWLNDTDKGYKAWRARVIYQTNLRTSHAAGRYKQMTDPVVLKRRPYWRYRHNTIENPRIQHQRWDNLVLPADAQFWKFNFPPNGYGCKCSVEAINERQLKAMGKNGPDDEPSFDSDRTDFDSAPGASWFPDLNKYPEPIAKAFVAENMRDGVFERWLQRIGGQVAELVATVAYRHASEGDKVKIRRRIAQGEKYPVAVLSSDQQAMLGVKTQVVLFSEDDAIKQTVSRQGNTGFDIKSYLHVQTLLEQAVLIVRQNIQQQHTLWIEGFDPDGQRYIAVLHQTKDNKELFLKSYRLDSKTDLSKEKEKGEVLYER
ncbi:phage head morphogenesis protein [Acinetobacter sp. SCLZS86]|uniref:phage head morphogenesis protein n=1 Tax=Acinetobacter sp. SCLZS86 TaxID=2908637 RepID=UPI001F427E8B|nr:phage minor head protein [Acinetobacter sp. SCLZS86]UIZ57788.1 phage head morphogenesis protein [Acinetobacter sp. SCLZS86]